MTFTRAVAAAFLVAASGLLPEGAVARTKNEVPAEFPPADYTGRQYVDSKGCVFIRANTGGLVDWIPRVTRQRQHICNAKPTFATAAPAERTVATAPAAAAVEITVAPDPAPVAVTKPTRSASRTGSSQPLPLPEPMRAAPVAEAAPVPVPAAATTAQQRQPRFTLSSLFAPRQRVIQRDPVVAAPAAPVVTPAAPRVTATAACPGGLSVSARYLGTGAGVRCGPQAISPVGPRQGRGVSVQAPGATTASGAEVSYSRVARGSDRVVPSHVYTQQQNAQRGVEIPNGYRPLWTDDRLNPKRAHQTLAGKAQMDLIWTQTVPRQLIDRASGRDVTRFFPGLSYPHTSFAQQDSAVSGRVTVSSKSYAPASVAPAARNTPRAVAKSSAPAQATYVQVAMFAQPGNAQRTAGKLAAKGLPMRIWNAKRGGKAVQLVVVGPFADASQARGALSAVKRAGFSDAYLR